MGTRTIDARPSDAVNFALLAKAPIRVAGDLLAAKSASRACFEQAIAAEPPTGVSALAAEIRQRLATYPWPPESTSKPS